MTGVTLYAVHFFSRIGYGYVVYRALHRMACFAYFIRTPKDQIFLRGGMGFVTGRAFPLLERHMDMRVLEPLAQGFMTIPAQVFLFLDQKFLVFPAMSIMAIGAYSFFERIMHEFLIQRIFHFFMTTET
jgi:hypothetical protein